jgi:hypothetical protein
VLGVWKALGSIPGLQKKKKNERNLKTKKEKKKQRQI